MFSLLDPVKDFDRFIEQRPESSYSKQMLSEIKLLKASPDGLIMPFGSAAYRIQQYPGDLDLLETYTGCCSAEEVTKKFARYIQNTIKRIISSRLHYYSEAKAGIDERYNFDIGELDNGIYYPDEHILDNINYLQKKKLIDSEDVDIITQAVLKAAQVKNSSDNYDIVMFILRKYFVLRWSSDEILKGSKKLPGNQSIKLADALNVDSLVKIDEITQINNRFIEITNAFFLSYKDSEGIHHEIHTINKPRNIYVSLPEDIEKLYFSNMWYSPFKALKRIFSFCRAPENSIQPVYRDILDKLFPFISSGTSLIYQIKSELESIIIVLENPIGNPMISINKQIDGMKFRLGNVLEIPQAKLIEMDTHIDKIVKTASKVIKIKLIESLVKTLKRIINYNTIVYLDSVKLNPPPRAVLPENPRYNWGIIRTPEEDPINPLKLLHASGGNAGVHSDWHSNPFANQYMNHPNPTSGGWNLFDFY